MPESCSGRNGGSGKRRSAAEAGPARQQHGVRLHRHAARIAKRPSASCALQRGDAYPAALHAGCHRRERRACVHHARARMDKRAVRDAQPLFRQRRISGDRGEAFFFALMTRALRNAGLRKCAKTRVKRQCVKVGRQIQP